MQFLVYEQLIIDIYAKIKQTSCPLRRENNPSNASRARMVGVGILLLRIHGLHVHRWWCWVLDRLIRVFVKWMGPLATPAATARIYSATHDQNHKHETTNEDVWPITLNGAFNVLFLLAR